MIVYLIGVHGTQDVMSEFCHFVLRNTVLICKTTNVFQEEP